MKLCKLRSHFHETRAEADECDDRTRAARRAALERAPSDEIADPDSRPLGAE